MFLLLIFLVHCLASTYLLEPYLSSSTLLLGTTFSRNNVIILLIIAIVGTILSILSYQYSTLIADEIADISSKDVKSNAKIEIHELSRILVKSIDSVSINLLTLRDALMLIDDNKNENLLTSAQNSTGDLTDGYYLLDSKGIIISQSIDGSSNRNHYGLNLSDTLFFSMPKSTNKPYYGNSLSSTNQSQYLYISYPLFKSKLVQNLSGLEFDGVVVAALDLAQLGFFLQKEIPPEFASNIGLIDKDGTILYSRNQEVIGKNYLSSEFQSLVPIEIKETYNNILRESLSGYSGLYDLSIKGNITTIAYQSIVIGGKDTWTLYISIPHNLATDVGFLINQQKNFSTIVIIVIVSLAFGIALVVLSLNKRLENAVQTRTFELKTANESLLESNDLLGSANRQLEIHGKMQKEFINVAAHELRTPIMPILGEAELIENKMNSDKVSQIDKEQILVIIRNAKRLDRLAADILDVTRIEGKSLNLNKTEFDIDEVLSPMVAEYGRQIEKDEKKKDLSIIYYPFHFQVIADKGRITQVLSNLVNNAIKFTEYGNITISVNIVEREILIYVKDCGKGIDPEILGRLFAKFASKSERGTGLGLFISKNIVESHGGRIWGYNNVEEKGATFVFTLPTN